MIEAVIFDLDGVIVDSEPMHLIVDRDIIRSNGIEISDDELKKYIGISNVKLWTDLIEKYKVKHTVEEMVNQQKKNKIEAFKNSNLKPIDGVVELINSIKENKIRLALASSSPLEFVETVLKKTGLLEKFEVILSGESFKRGKPEPDIFLAAAKELGKAPSQCVVIEDSAHGVQAAKSAGMKCIGYINQGSGNQDLSHADFTVRHFSELTIDKILN